MKSHTHRSHRRHRRWRSPLRPHGTTPPLPAQSCLQAGVRGSPVVRHGGGAAPASPPGRGGDTLSHSALTTPPRGERTSGSGAAGRSIPSGAECPPIRCVAAPEPVRRCARSPRIRGRPTRRPPRSRRRLGGRRQRLDAGVACDFHYASLTAYLTVGRPVVGLWITSSIRPTAVRSSSVRRSDPASGLTLDDKWRRMWRGLGGAPPCAS